MAYTRDLKIHYHDCDGGGRCKISAAMRYLQQTSSEQLDDMGIPYERLFQEGTVFLLAKMCIRLHAPLPSGGETMRVSTTPTKTKGARYIRDFVVEDGHGNRLASALSFWLLADPVSRKILRPSAFPHSIPFTESILEGAVEDIPIPKIQQDDAKEEFIQPVRYSHIDRNLHVNNSVYADMVCDMLPFEPLMERGLSTLAISYHSEARWGDQLTLWTREVSPGEYACTGRNNSSVCFEAFAAL